MGIVSSIGTGADEFAAGLRAGRDGAGEITVFDPAGFPTTIGCEVPDFDPRRWTSDERAGSLDRIAQLAVAAAVMAVRHAGVDLAALRERRGAISLGTNGRANAFGDLCAAEIAAGGGQSGPPPAGAALLPADLVCLEVARELGLADVETATVGTACSAGNYAIANAFDAIRAGDVEFALCGGVDPMCVGTFASFTRFGTVAADACRPFDADRTGMLIGEGSAVLVLEPLDAALARGARIHAEVLGAGLNCDAFHQVAPDQDGVADCIRRALADAGVRPQDVDLVSAHGTATKANDVVEVAAIREVFGDATPPVISVKSMLGHTMGAASALAAAACVLALEHGFIPPTTHHRRTDPECDVDCVPNVAREADLRIVQNNSLGFGGNNAVLVLGRYDA
jgi:3-oxoacyl-[acyl-carrier-protein] synthase II